MWRFGGTLFLSPPSVLSANLETGRAVKQTRRKKIKTQFDIFLLMFKSRA
jgi:hypothetical protein